MTSGNLGGEPICFTDDDALERLSHLADGWLMHDRAILVPCDDSVVRVVTVGGADNQNTVGGADNQNEAVELPIRRSRGYAPLPIALPVPVPPTMAVGADLKNAMAVADGKYAWLSQHIGDMDDLATLSAFDAAQQHLQELTSVAPEVLVADAHPLYRSTAWAHRNAAGRPVRTVQHHHAHIAAVMAEHGLDGSQHVLGSPSMERVTDPTRLCGAARCCSPTTRAPTTGATRTCRSPAATSACCVPTGWRWPICGRRESRGSRICRRWQPALPMNCGCSPPARDGSRLRADIQHGTAVRRGVRTHRRPADGRV